MTARPTGLALLEQIAGTLAPALGDAAGDTWFVGGVVRDALLGRDLPDVDLVTAGDVGDVARRTARVVGGTAFPLSDRHGSWRITARPADVRGGDIAADDGPHELLQLDITALRAEDLAADLALRDLTINAMAAPVLDPHALVDLHGGRGDLDAGIVRMVAARAFDDDPLRMLRTVRIAHVLGMAIEEATVAAIRERAPRAAEPSGERTFSELGLLLAHPEARAGLRLLERAGLEAVLLPELAACRGVDQSRFHHLDVHEHTLAVLDNIEDVVDATAFWLPAPDGVEVAPWTADQRALVLFAAVAHDLGKPATRTLRANGSPSFVGHDAVGAEIVDALCDRWRTSNTFRTGLRRLVATHLDLGFLLHGARDARAVHRFLEATRPVSAEAIVLSVADRLATAGPDDRRRWVRYHLDLARTLWTAHWQREREGLPVPLLDGTQIAEHLGIAPGPAIGAVARVLAEEQAIGAVRTREEALATIERAFSELPG